MAATESKYKIWEPLLLSMVCILGMMVGAKFTQTNMAGKDTALTNSKYSGRQVEEIIKFLETRYVTPINSDSIAENAIATILNGLDPHTHYFPPDQRDELEERTMGHYVGIGIEIVFLQDSLVVLYPKEDSPASRAGLRPGDYIIAVDGVRIPQDTLDKSEILDLIKGEKGTKVRLTVKPMLSHETKVVEVVRDEIKVPSVSVGYMVDTAIAYIKVERFTNTTYREFMDKWENLYTQRNARHLILDLRDNPGGCLKEAVNMLSQIFPEEGKLLVYTEGLHQRRVDYKSTGKVFFPVEKICVLINEGSASASEIIAGCIQDQDRGVVLGAKSFGKGLVQEQFALSNGGTLRMTVSKYYTPSGRSIQKAYDATSTVDTSMIFKTTLGRPVHAGGGISPDIPMTDTVDWGSREMMLWMDVISEYAIRYNLEKYDGHLTSIDQVNTIHQEMPARDVLMSGIEAIARKRLPQVTVDSLMWYETSHQEQLFRIAEATVIAYRTGEEGWYVGFNEHDPVVNKAKDVVKMDLLMALKQ